MSDTPTRTPEEETLLWASTAWGELMLLSDAPFVPPRVAAALALLCEHAPPGVIVMGGLSLLTARFNMLNREPPHGG